MPIVGGLDIHRKQPATKDADTTPCDLHERHLAVNRSEEVQYATRGFALGACGGLARILMPSAVNTASKDLVNWPARSLIKNLTEVTRWPRSIRKLRAACVVELSGCAVTSAR